MTVSRSLDELEPGRSVATIGFFDGVHIGHQRIVRDAIDAARGRGVRAVAVTFDRHPMEVVRPEERPPLLMTRERRVRTLLDVGVDEVLVLPFTRGLSELSPEDFAVRVLVDGLAADAVVVGRNFRFGHRAAGDVDTLVELGEHHGFDVRAVDLLELDGRSVSSTIIRERVASGDVAWAARALGRPHVLDGTVVRGDGRGRSLGVPTANIDVSARMRFPANGIYAGHVRIAGEDREVPAATSVGVRPTFGGQDVTVEAHLLGFDGDLYGAEVAVTFVHRLRDEERFDRIDDLVAQMREDIERARVLLADT